MPEAIRVVATGLGTADWRVERAGGTYLCDIRIELSALFYGSRYFILRDGEFRKMGKLTLDFWDEETVREVLTEIVHEMYPDARVTVEMPQRLRRAAG